MGADGTAPHVVVIGGGFTGLSAALELTRRGVAATVVEADAEVGGLAGSFAVEGARLEKFYHHWFTSDTHVADLVRDIGAEGEVLYRPTRTGMYFANQQFRLSTPLDVLKFKPLALFDRVRLGWLALRAQRVRDWRALEHLSAEEWLRALGGENVYRVVWEPLLSGKFGEAAREVSAVWFWNKLKLRGGSRSKRGAEVLAYFRGGFAALAERMRAEILARGGRVRLNSEVTGLAVHAGRVTGVWVGDECISADAVIATPALPVVASLIEPYASREYVASLRRIKYLANVCVVLELDRSLSDTYWLNVNEPGFPFVGVIEHTNFEPPESYGGRHIVYLSKYLPEEHELFRMSDDALFEYCLLHLQRMFPSFGAQWVLRRHVWRARYSQPIVVRGYSRLVPAVEMPLSSLFLATMAQIYPEDRGTNYAIRDGRRVGQLVSTRLARGKGEHVTARHQYVGR